MAILSRKHFQPIPLDIDKRVITSDFHVTVGPLVSFLVTLTGEFFFPLPELKVKTILLTLMDSPSCFLFAQFLFPSSTNHFRNAPKQIPAVWNANGQSNTKGACGMRKGGSSYGGVMQRFPFPMLEDKSCSLSQAQPLFFLQVVVGVKGVVGTLIY